MSIFNNALKNESERLLEILKQHEPMVQDSNPKTTGRAYFDSQRMWHQVKMNSGDFFWLSFSRETEKSPFPYHVAETVEDIDLRLS